MMPCMDGVGCHGRLLALYVYGKRQRPGKGGQPQLRHGKYLKAALEWVGGKSVWTYFPPSLPRHTIPGLAHSDPPKMLLPPPLIQTWDTLFLPLTPDDPLICPEPQL